MNRKIFIYSSSRTGFRSDNVENKLLLLLENSITIVSRAIN